MIIPDYVELEMDLARIMARQEASGFRLDIAAATRIQKILSSRFEKIRTGLIHRFPAMKGKLKIPKVRSSKRNTQAGCPFHELLEFNPTSRVHIAHALQTLGVEFDKKTDSGQIQIDEDILASVMEDHDYSRRARKSARHFRTLLKLQKWMGQLSEGANAWIKKVGDDGCIHHSCRLATQTGRNAHSGPNLGQVVSAPWARQLFVPHKGHVLVGVDLEGLELRALGHFLAPYDEGRFAHIVVNGDIHQINADSVSTPETPISRKLVKSLTYGFIYGAGDVKLGKLVHPTLSESSQRIRGKELRQKFLDAIPGLEPLVAAVKDRIRTEGQLKGLDGRPITCTAEHAGLNYCLQGSGAVLSKRWVVIAYNDVIAKYEWGKDFTFCVYCHDEIQASCRPEIAEDIKTIIEAAALKAGEYYNFRVPITAAGEIGTSWQDTH
ncbi:DNA polymerase [Synechococcus sp. WH 8016]|uniref:DNA polymerase n=1 Tax=Synechococcus sp. WH 8016 TaxID=166318 RepID=UPI00022D7D97|nr:DNA polymerase [Synechococcus sp. WH 8016]EHA63803.1 DNA-directed DNA polymerase [Synechococcus sp. WH 8016]